MTLEYGFAMYWIGATRNVLCHHDVESALSVFGFYDLMAVSVTDHGSIKSFCTVHTGYSISFPNTALCDEHASAFFVRWGI